MTIQAGLWFDPSKLFVGGAWRPATGGASIPVENPSTGETIASIAAGTADDVEAAVAAAEAALDGEWGAMTATERGRILMRLSRLVEERAETLAHLESADIGKPIAQARNDAKALARYFEFYGGAADKVMGLFKGREEELKAHSTTPEKAMERLLFLNNFAQQKPHEYLAWVARETKGDAAHEALGEAAKLLGYKIVADAEEPDEFEDEEVAKLRKENAELKRAQTPAFGPDAPDQVARRSVMEALQDFTTAIDDAGALKHPHFETLKPRITQLAAAHKQSTGQFVTAEDLTRFYSQAETEMRSVFAPPSSSAAQDPTPVADQKVEKAAAAAEKAKAASKLIDGDGQGAPRRPGPGADADLKSVLSHFANQSED